MVGFAALRPEMTARARRRQLEPGGEDASLAAVRTPQRQRARDEQGAATKALKPHRRGASVIDLPLATHGGVRDSGRHARPRPVEAEPSDAAQLVDERAPAGSRRRAPTQQWLQPVRRCPVGSRRRIRAPRRRSPETRVAPGSRVKTLARALDSSFPRLTGISQRYRGHHGSSLPPQHLLDRSDLSGVIRVMLDEAVDRLSEGDASPELAIARIVDGRRESRWV